MIKRTFLKAGAAVCGAAIWPSLAMAQKHAFGNPVTVGLPLQAGSASDIAVRYVTNALSTQLGVSFVVENITGAGGIVGLDRLARAKPDGQTLAALNNSILTILPHLQPQNIKIDTLTEFDPIAGIANIPTFFAVPTQSSIDSIEDLVQQARKEPDRIHYASGGIGSPQHLAGEMFNAYAGVKLIHVPYRGASQATLAVASNEVQVMPMALSLAKPFLAERRIRLIGYCGTERHLQYPKVPTLIEQGIKNYDYSSWIALFAQKGIPTGALNDLRRATATVVNDPAIQEKMLKAGLDPWPRTPEQLVNIMRTDYARWQKIIKDSDIQGT
mgnify:CR=1 FL=1